MRYDHVMPYLPECTHRAWQLGDQYATWVGRTPEEAEEQKQVRILDLANQGLELDGDEHLCGQMGSDIYMCPVRVLA